MSKHILARPKAVLGALQRLIRVEGYGGGVATTNMTVAGSSYCGYCGTKIESTSRFCPSCGKPTSLAASKPTQERREGRDLPRSYTKMTDEEYYYNYRDASGAWFLLPVFLGLIGGILMWLALRNEDPRKARDGLYVGIVFFILGVIIIWFISVAASAYGYSGKWG